MDMDSHRHEVFSFSSFQDEKEMLQSHEAFSFKGFLPRSGGFSHMNPENEGILIMAETDWGEQQKTPILPNDASMRSFFPASHGELSLSIGARFQQQPFVQRVPYSGSELQNLPFQSVESFNEETYCNVKISKYLNPTKELLHMICNVGDEVVGGVSRQAMLSKKWERAGRPSPSSLSTSMSLALKNLDILELQRLKFNLLKLLEEVERRYIRYRERRRPLVCSFEASAGSGAATPYLSLASKAMSRHFRRLKDGIMEQIEALKKVMKEKDHIVPCMLRGETPRLKLVDQCFQQHKAFQLRGSATDQLPWRTHRGLPERSVSVLRAWLFEHFLHPYPSDIDKHILARQTGLSRRQVSNWFINARVRLWKPMIEKMYIEAIKERENNQAELKNFKRNPSPTSLHGDDKEQNLIVIVGTESNSGSLSTIVNARHCSEEHGFTSYGGYSTMENFKGNGVNLTLGLQKDEGGSMGFSFQNQQNLFYSGEQMEVSQLVNYS